MIFKYFALYGSWGDLAHSSLHNGQIVDSLNNQIVYKHEINPKYEYRNTKQIQNSNVQMFKTKSKKL
jgi:hypothetical protein